MSVHQDLTTEPTKLDRVSRRGVLQTGAGLAAAGLVLGFRPQVYAAPLSSASVNSATDADSQAFAPNVYVEIPTTGKVRLIIHRTEMGQGVRTSLPMLLAEELEVPWDQIELVQAVGDKKYGNQNTDGSTSIRLNWEALPKAGAAAREMLVAAAAKQWGVDASACRAENGTVIHGDQKLGYGELAAEAAKLEVPESPKVKKPSEWKVAGKSRGLVDVPDITQGKATYGFDVQLPGMLFASVERSPTVAGTIKSVDSAAAQEIRGVRKVFELPRRPQPMNTSAGVAIVAENTWAALQARDALEIEWDRDGASENSDEFRKQLEALVEGDGKEIRKEGDFAQAKAGAAKTITTRFHGPYLVHAPMEPLAATALFEDGACEVWAPTQDPQTARSRVAAVLGIDEAQVTINVTLLGGGFGRKSKPDFIIEAVHIAKEMAGTPVKLIWTREDEVRHGFYRAQNAQKVDATIDADGKVTGWHHHTAFPTILSTFMAGAKDPAPFELGMGFTNMPYRIPNVLLEASGIQSDLRIGWLRSVCNTFHAHAVNCTVDEIAESVGKDPVKWRLEALGEPRVVSFSERDQPYQLDTARLTRVIEKAAEMSSWGSALPAGQGHGFASHFSFLTYVAMAMSASVEDGKARVHDVHVAVDCGTVVNPDTVIAQMEGAVVFGLSYALYGEITVKDGVVRQSNFSDYPILRIDEMPEVHVEILRNDNPPSGIGEPGVPPVAPALANALYKATGKRYYDLPLAGQLG